MKLHSIAAAAGVAVAMTLATAPAAHAADPSPQLTYADNAHFYTAILPGYFFASHGRNTLRNGGTVSILAGYQFMPEMEVEANIFGTKIFTSSHQPLGNAYQQGLTLDLAYNLFGTDRTGFTPFVIAGVGAVHDITPVGKYTSWNFQADAGLGAVSGALFHSGWFQGLKIRAEVRWLYDNLTNAKQKGMHDYRGSIGLELPIGIPPPPPPPPPPEPPVKVVKEQVKVIHCPIPFPGAKLDKYGCAIAPQTVVLSGVHFAFNKSDLRPDAKTILNQVAKAMGSQKSMTVEIEGHTDDIGSQKYNLKLSQQRADQVMNYLVNQGVDASRMQSKGYGESKPIVTPQDTPEARAQNRRVEFHILTP